MKILTARWGDALVATYFFPHPSLGLLNTSGENKITEHLNFFEEEKRHITILFFLMSIAVMKESQS